MWSKFKFAVDEVIIYFFHITVTHCAMTYQHYQVTLSAVLLEYMEYSNTGIFGFSSFQMKKIGIIFAPFLLTIQTSLIKRSKLTHAFAQIKA